MGNTFGKMFAVTTWGESHGDAVGVVIDGCPPTIKLDESDIQSELDRRRPAQSKITTQRKEQDKAQIISGVFEGRTLGTPIMIVVWNEDARSKDYNHMKDIFRPSHADYTYQMKYGVRNWKGGGRSSARETVGRVASGAIAKLILRQQYSVEITSYVKQIADMVCELEPDAVDSSKIENNIVRCPDQKLAEEMIKKIEEARKNGDSLGGVVETIVRGMPVGIGEPVFDKLDADLAKGILSIPACRGFEIGSGFSSVTMTGSSHNDEFHIKNSVVRTKTNFSGGVQGGISNGENIVLRAAFKPTGTIVKEQQTVDIYGNEVSFGARGRHDPCVLPRAVPIVESMTALVIIDHILRQRGQVGSVMKNNNSAD